MAVGATMMGMEILNPSTVVLRSTLVTSTRMRGRNLQVVEKSTEGIKVQEISQDCITNRCGRMQQERERDDANRKLVCTRDTRDASCFVRP